MTNPITYWCFRAFVFYQMYTSFMIANKNARFVINNLHLCDFDERV